MGSFSFWVGCGYYRDVLAMIGPRMTQELDFPARAVNRLFCSVYAVVGLQTILACLFVYSWLCVSLLVAYSLRNHAQLRGGSVAERLRSTLAYGWVERCSDVAGCGMNTA